MKILVVLQIYSILINNYKFLTKTDNFKITWSGYPVKCSEILFFVSNHYENFKFHGKYSIYWYLNEKTTSRLRTGLNPNVAQDGADENVQAEQRKKRSSPNVDGPKGWIFLMSKTKNKIFLSTYFV